MRLQPQLMCAVLLLSPILVLQPQARIMRQDWSWNRPALDYCDLYYSTMKS